MDVKSGISRTGKHLPGDAIFLTILFIVRKPEKQSYRNDKISSWRNVAPHDHSASTRLAEREPELNAPVNQSPRGFDTCFLGRGTLCSIPWILTNSLAFCNEYPVAAVTRLGQERRSGSQLVAGNAGENQLALRRLAGACETTILERTHGGHFWPAMQLSLRAGQHPLSSSKARTSGHPAPHEPSDEQKPGLQLHRTSRARTAQIPVCPQTASNRNVDL